MNASNSIWKAILSLFIRKSYALIPIKVRKNKLPFILLILTFVAAETNAQWLDFTDETDTRLVLTSVANNDDEEKDISAADLNNDGWTDVIVVRKEPFSNPNEPPKSDLLLINEGGVLTDRTAEYAPEFLSNPTFARDLFIADFDGDGWQDVVIANTFDQQPMFFHNLGNDANGDWLGLADESATRFPTITADIPLLCAVWGGDLTGNGAMDIYMCNYKQNGGGGVAKDYLLINDGNGNFTEEGEARLGDLRNSAFGTAVQIADIDGDGDNDVLKVSTLFGVPPWNGNGLIVLFNEGDGNFTNWQNIASGQAPYMFEIADYNQDGQLDIFGVDDGSDRLFQVTGVTVDNSLTITQTNLGFPSSSGFGGNVHAADIDLDGDMDICVSDVDVDIPPCNSGRRIAIYRNDNGVFSDPYGANDYPWVDNSYDMAWLDINNDGLLDFFTGGCDGYGLYMSDNCDLIQTSADFDLDGIPDACDECPTNPDPACQEPIDFPMVSTDHTIARQWNELTLESIRGDFARPTVHARNLFHISAAMWDAWAAYDDDACTYLLGQNVQGFDCAFTGIPDPVDVEAARHASITYAAYRLLSHRFQNAPEASLLQQGYDFHMTTLGYDIAYTDMDYTNGDPRALGNYIADCMINYGLQDGSNEVGLYGNTAYAPVNPPLIVDNPGNPTIIDMNRWQPLTLDLFIDQSGNEIPGETPDFLSPEWGQVNPFSLSDEDKITYSRDGFDYQVYHDPGMPPLLEPGGGGTSDLYKWGFSMVAIWSGHLDATDGVMMDISPASLGNRNNLPADFSDFDTFYNYLTGGSVSDGHAVNPATGAPYTPNMVPRADYARVLAEFWADGPDSETPPGHWFSIANYVADHPELSKQFMGEGAVLDDLEWDVKMYFALGGAMHDCAVSAWGVKGWYDYLRPVSAIRAMADLGQSSDPTGVSYHPEGLPLVPGYIEVIELGDALAGASNENVGKIKLYAWRGHKAINNVDTDEAGVGWILAEEWEPYQRPSFVTPPFAGYVSGHSTYSRAAAELLEAFTGDAYFPGGMGVFDALQDEFLVFEDGPSQTIELQWATYQDAADESALSRIWGGIHPPADDIPGRKIGIEVGNDAFNKAITFFGDSDFDGICDAHDAPCLGDLNNDGYRDINDLLMYLGDFGCTSGCVADANGDGAVNSADLVGIILPTFAVPCGN